MYSAFKLQLKKSQVCTYAATTIEKNILISDLKINIGKE